ncbi:MULTISPECIES: ATP-binding protein [Pseudomonas]|uniref:Signal transduction histidine kinase n=1 Tax=Pseudomonas hunanensis TaxID=1247546 RepID=A0ACC6K8W3_9PSED|nr:MULTISPECIES: ATP-binding protein [Pseudomonas]MBP2262866.1 signal transduction histidine kinase [Pseudomonas sp. BP8]MDR6714878.1 signal transduction histidine kinase [Pseudomonas hunanensis]HDS1737697.1 histidine kinase [Pseudomonas putida]
MPEPMPSSAAEQAALITRLQAENQSLRGELEETNQGVLALYAELDIQAEQLRQASDLKSRFLSYMSHEFRTPLGSILSITSLLADEVDGPLSKEQQLQVAFVSTATRELSDMVDDLLDLAKIEAGRITISPAWFDMLDLFSALRGMFRPIVDTGAVDLIFEEPHGLPQLYTDDKKLMQILRNFISNALKFTLRGEVRVSAQLLGSAQIRFAVTDTGIGIAPELLGALFEDFAQVDSPLQKRLRGTGLGLSLCKRFAALLGGEVGVDSVPGVGSSFFVIIPLAIAQENADEP